MEGNFNAANKIVYGTMMLKNACKHQLMPEEIFSKRNRMADTRMLCKTLFYDITRQARVPAAFASVDASYCYNRIAHAMASMIFQAFGVPTTAIESMLGAIENMKFFLRTGFGDSKSFAGGGISIKMQGLCQGNGASPAGWVVISICILRAHGKKGHGAKFLSLITKLQHHLSAILYVDDTDLLHINLTKDELVEDVFHAIQGVLIAGGTSSLQLAECSNQANASTPSSCSNGQMANKSTPRTISAVSLVSQCLYRAVERRQLVTKVSATQRRHSEQ
jgi:hypothetical protein